MSRFSIARSLIATASIVTVILVLAAACAPPADDGAGNDVQQAEAQAFLDSYTETWLDLAYTAEQADWQLNTRIVEGDDTNAKRSEAATAALAAYTGSVENIEEARRLLESRDALDPLQARQLDKVLYRAADNPQTEPELVKRRIAAETSQVEKLFGFDFQLDGQSVTTNDIDDRLGKATDVADRLELWSASKEVGTVLGEGLAELVELRNGTVQSLGHDDYFAYQVSDYGMSVEEMMKLNHGFVREVWPLYRQLHTWARYELAEKYGASEVPEMLPAHWLPNRWGQDWSQLVTVEGLDLDAALADKEAEWVVRQGEDFYVSLGFDRLPASFWEKSSLYPLPEGAEYKKNNHASAWHMDLREDVRSLMSVQPNERWWATTHHELGHIYYYMSYTRPEVPPLLRRGANRGFHEAIGDILGLASTQKPFLVERGLTDGDVETDAIQALLREALGQIVFIPWSAGVMTHFERDLYAGLAPEEYNQRWWSYVESFQGITPPEARSGEYCDACTKTHINDDAAQYYDYAVSSIILYQMRQHIAEEILDQDAHATNYWGREDVGAFLSGILEVGATRDWREVMSESLGEEISAAAMLAYFEPLTAYLEEQNAGRVHTLPESPTL
ncbi:MAG: M2 family metallopeptidase [bacterium]|nr:M2 family metallopeptidase [bacterium]